MTGVCDSGSGRSTTPRSDSLVDLIRFPRGTIWHLPTRDGIEAGHAAALCGATHGQARHIERGFDPKIISHAGFPVCASCRRALRGKP